jgi:hypothetical protein
VRCDSKKEERERRGTRDLMEKTSVAIESHGICLKKVRLQANVGRRPPRAIGMGDRVIVIVRAPFLGVLRSQHGYEGGSVQNFSIRRRQPTSADAL